MGISTRGRRNLKAVGSGVRPRDPPSTAQTQLAAPAGGTGAAAGGWDTAGNRDLAIASINAARTDIAALFTILRDNGLVA